MGKKTKVMGQRDHSLPRNITFINDCRRRGKQILRHRLITIMLMVLLILGLGGHFAIGDVAVFPHESVLAQTETAANRLNLMDIAQAMAESNFEDEINNFNIFIIFFVTLGPLKIIPVFMQVAHNASTALKRQLAFRSTAISTVVILLVVLIGQQILKVWQIQLPAMMIAGGILLSLVALRLILTQYSPNPSSETAPEAPGLHLAVTPLAFPTILPPFGIAIALTLMIMATQLNSNAASIIALLLLVMVINFISMLAAGPILKFIRPVTLKILSFTLGVMQFALGIQFVLVGLGIQALVIHLMIRSQ
ncbi:MAG: MarC family protein [Cyanobacteria bacterium P01_F01_bin.56]